MIVLYLIESSQTSTEHMLDQYINRLKLMFVSTLKLMIKHGTIRNIFIHIIENKKRK
jgi:hypothetical protein